MALSYIWIASSYLFKQWRELPIFYKYCYLYYGILMIIMASIVYAGYETFIRGKSTSNIIIWAEVVKHNYLSWGSYYLSEKQLVHL